METYSLNIRVIVLHEGGVAHLLERTLAAAPPLMLPLKAMLLDYCAHRYMHRPGDGGAEVSLAAK